jgi:hypothetical protein
VANKVLSFFVQIKHCTITKKVDDVITIYTRNHIFKQSSVGCSHAFHKKTEQRSNLDDMFHNNTPSFLTLPIELIYRILDHLQLLDILLSVREVCSRLNVITDTYYPYQVNFTFIFYSDVQHHYFEILTTIRFFRSLITHDDCLCDDIFTLFCVINNQVVSEYIRYKSLHLFLGMHNNCKP